MNSFLDSAMSTLVLIRSSSSSRVCATEVKESLPWGHWKVHKPHENWNHAAPSSCKAMVGSRGLWPTLAALEAGKVVALANKESLVAGGDLVMGRVKEDPSRLLPVDSEHSAIFQCLAGNRLGDVERIIVTASGGPFRRSSRKQMQAATLSDALRHPTWKMGAKITIDS